METKMSQPIQNEFNLTLKETARNLSCDDLLRITEVAEKAKAAVHISHGSYQFLIGIPEDAVQFVGTALEELGYPFVQDWGRNFQTRLSFIVSRGMN